MSLARTDDSVHRERAAKASDRLLASLLLHHGKKPAKPVEAAPTEPKKPKAPKPITRIFAFPPVKAKWFSMFEPVGPRRYYIQEIQLAVSEHFNISVADLIGKDRHAPFVLARQLGYFFSKKLAARSLPEIGRRFGNRDHTTVLHGIRKIEGRMNEGAIENHLEQIRKAIDDCETSHSHGSVADQATIAVPQGGPSASSDLA